MITRLVLVGLVAALGVTLPSRPDCERYFGGAQIWASGLLANWDTWQSRESEACYMGMDSVETATQRGLNARVPYLVDRVTPARATVPTTLSASARSTPAPRVVAAGGMKRLPSMWADGPIGEWGSMVANKDSETAGGKQLCPLVETGSAIAIGAPRTPARVAEVVVARPSGIECDDARLAALPTELFAPAETRTEPQVVSAPLPIDVLAPLGTERAVRTAEWAALPTTVFAPVDARFQAVVVNFQNLPAELFAPAARETVPASDPGESFELCGDQMAWNEPPGELDSWTGDESQRPVSSIDARPLTPSLIVDNFDDSVMDAVEFETTGIALAHGAAAEQGSPLDQSARPDRNALTQRTSNSRLTSNTLPVSPERAGEDLHVTRDDGRDHSPPCLDQAVRLTRQALRAWVDVLTGSHPVEVTSR